MRFREHAEPALAAVLVCACMDPASSPTFLDHPLEDFPSTLREVGLYAEPASLEVVDPRVVPYRPSLELWSNGSDKTRFVVVPDGDVITNDGAWQFPIGTLFFKTFSFSGKPVETRILRRLAMGWDYAVYLWNAGGTEGELLDLTTPQPVSVLAGGVAFVHEIPSRLDCRSCHESNATGEVIGFDELRLASPLPGRSESQLSALHDRGVLSTTPRASPETITGRSAIEREVVGYLHGNCAHCHNGLGGPNRSFDLRHPVAVTNLVDQPTEASGATQGIRVVPRSARESVALMALERTIDDVMPPIGVQVGDRTAADAMREWISSL